MCIRDRFLTHQTGNYPVTCFVSKPSRITLVELSIINTSYQKLPFGYTQRHVNVTGLSLIHISEPTRPERISYAVFCLKKKRHRTTHSNEDHRSPLWRYAYQNAQLPPKSVLPRITNVPYPMSLVVLLLRWDAYSVFRTAICPWCFCYTRRGAGKDLCCVKARSQSRLKRGVRSTRVKFSSTILPK